MIESCQIYRTRVTSQGAFAAHVEVDVEITHGKLAQAAIDRLAIATSGEIGFRHCAPMAVHFENRDDVVGVLFCLQIQYQWRKSQDAKRGRCEDSAFQA